MNYKIQLRDLFKDYLGADNVTFFTTDGGSDYYLKCGVIPDVYPTIDFGPGEDVNKSFASQRDYAPKGPLVNSEFYAGWLDFWGSPHSRVNTSDILKTFYDIMNIGANVNFYMFHGGTNFGFTNGMSLRKI
jgi:beta-galactosidase